VFLSKGHNCNEQQKPFENGAAGALYILLPCRFGGAIGQRYRRATATEGRRGGGCVFST